MKRILVIMVTVAGIGGLIALINYKPSTASTMPGVGHTSSSGVPTPGQLPVGVSYKNGTFTGDSIDVGYGPVQVAAVISGGKITNIEFLQMPSDREHSVEVTNFAKPQLLQEALTAQSATVDTVSGATATSDGFVQSLAAALKQAS